MPARTQPRLARRPRRPHRCLSTPRSHQSSVPLNKRCTVSERNMKTGRATHPQNSQIPQQLTTTTQQRKKYKYHKPDGEPIENCDGEPIENCDGDTGENPPYGAYPPGRYAAAAAAAPPPPAAWWWMAGGWNWGEW